MVKKESGADLRGSWLEMSNGLPLQRRGMLRPVDPKKRTARYSHYPGAAVQQ